MKYEASVAHVDSEKQEAEAALRYHERKAEAPAQAKALIAELELETLQPAEALTALDELINKLSTNNENCYVVKELATYRDQKRVPALMKLYADQGLSPQEAANDRRFIMTA
jgi:hypothetical protein